MNHEIDAPKATVAAEAPEARVARLPYRAPGLVRVGTLQQMQGYWGKDRDGVYLRYTDQGC